MRQAIDTALLSLLGWVNQAMFWVSGGRVVLYRFGMRCVLLTITGPAAPVSQTLVVGYLPDGDDHIVLATEADVGLPTALRAATAVTVELAGQHVPADVTTLSNDTERAALLKQLLKHASLAERHEVTRFREVPIARLTPHYKPAGRSVACPEIRSS